VSPARAGALAVLALVALDLAAVPTVLPSARIDLGSSTSGLLWIQSSYLLALALVLLLIAALGEAVDVRLLAAAGLAAFGMGALLASIADSTSAVVVGRTLQGAGTAALLPPAIGSVRGRQWMIVAALVVLAVAPLVGGALAEEASWRWLFRLELAPAALAALLLLAPPAPAPLRAARRPATLAAGLLLAAVALIQAGPWGWASADTLLFLATGAALLVLAWSDLPSGLDAIAPVLVACLAALFLFTPQYFELVRGLSPLRSGLLTVAVTGSAAVLAVPAGRAASRLGARAILVAGLAGAAVGALGATRFDPASSYAVIVVSLALVGAGTGAAAGALVGAGTADLVPGIAAGAALIVAAAGAVFERAQLDERDSGGSFEDALSAGLVGSAWLLAALLTVAAVLAWRRRP
jgi:hypothetical protein